MANGGKPELEAANYVAEETLRDGRRMTIRAQRPEDLEAIRSAARLTSERTRYLRFFAPKMSLSESEVAFFMGPDFVNHVALMAFVEESGRPVVVGGGRLHRRQAGDCGDRVLRRRCLSQARHRLPAHAPPGDPRPGGRPCRIRRRGPSRECVHARRVPQVRAADDDQAQRRRHPCLARLCLNAQ